MTRHLAPVDHQPMVAPDDDVRAEGKPLGRFSREVREIRQPQGGHRTEVGDWLPDPDGDHDGFEYKLGFFVLPREAA